MYQTGKEFAEKIVKCKFIETSAKTGQNIEKAMFDLATEIDEYYGQFL